MKRPVLSRGTQRHVGQPAARRMLVPDAAAAADDGRRASCRDADQGFADHQAGHDLLGRPPGAVHRGRERRGFGLRARPRPCPSASRPDGAVPAPVPGPHRRDGRADRDRRRQVAAHHEFRPRRRRHRGGAAARDPRLARSVRARRQPLPDERARAAAGVQSARLQARALDRARRADRRPARRERRQLAHLVRRARVAQAPRLARDLGAARARGRRFDGQLRRQHRERRACAT